ncbi:MAG: trypsin-like peptidase domain-containing protein, partial [Gammaproteobacteria bacterium]|nr:trypsin-like peptidase domain-containing protein [Gammaproteobacteria bacterium]
MNITHNRLVTRLRTSLITGVLATGLASNAGAAELPDFADLVEKNTPTIVHISTVRQVESRRPTLDPELEEQLRRLNPGEDLDLNLEDMLPEMRQRGAVGSGFLISDDGYVITNNHVVVGADEIKVTLNDRRVFDAEVIGLDEPS